MIKIRQKETATNLVYFYNLDTIESLDESNLLIHLIKTQSGQVLLKLILQ